jgi:hypothetical protein
VAERRKEMQMLGHKIGWGARVRLGGWVIALAALASLATAEAAGDAFAAKAGCASQTAGPAPAR